MTRLSRLIGLGCWGALLSAALLVLLGQVGAALIPLTIAAGGLVALAISLWWR
jgi:hypothetical protein